MLGGRMPHRADDNPDDHRRPGWPARQRDSIDLRLPALRGEPTLHPRRPWVAQACWIGWGDHGYIGIGQMVRAGAWLDLIGVALNLLVVHTLATVVFGLALW